MHNVIYALLDLVKNENYLLTQTSQFYFINAF